MKSRAHFLVLIPFIISCFSLYGLAKEQQIDDKIFIVDIKDVVSNPNLYDKKKVSLEGKVNGVKYTTSGEGIPFTFFKLKDEFDNEVGVYYENGHLQISKGDNVRIMGRYKKEKSYFLFKYKNVIKARTVEEI